MDFIGEVTGERAKELTIEQLSRAWVELFIKYSRTKNEPDLHIVRCEIFSRMLRDNFASREIDYHIRDNIIEAYSCAKASRNYEYLGKVIMAHQKYLIEILHR